MFKGKFINQKKIILRKYTDLIFASFKFRTKNLKLNNKIALCSEPRGGSTFLTELFLNLHPMALLWEPLHFNVLKKYNPNFQREIGFIPYIPENEIWEDALSYFESLFDFSFLTKEMIQHPVNHSKYLNSTHTLFVKFTRANILLPWLSKNFPKVKFIYLVRHPLAVISSQYRHPNFNRVGTEVNVFEIQNSKYKDLFAKYNKNITSIETRDDMMANWWAINNTIPLNHPYNNKKWLTVSYENLLKEREFELRRICDFLELQFDSKILRLFDKPSATTQKGAEILSGGNQLKGWKKYFSDQQVERMISIVNKYGIHSYTDELFPDLDILYNK